MFHTLYCITAHIYKKMSQFIQYIYLQIYTLADVPYSNGCDGLSGIECINENKNFIEKQL